MVRDAVAASSQSTFTGARRFPRRGARVGGPAWGSSSTEAQRGAARHQPVPAEAPSRPGGQAPPQASPPLRKLGRVPALDGVRGAAVLAVLAFHLRPLHLFGGGWLGVDVFFALSGFLITSLLLQEVRSTGRFSFRRFYARRALRLQPGLLVFLGVWLVMLFVAHDQFWFSTVPSFPVNRHGTVPIAVGLRGFFTALFQVNNWLSAFRHPGGPIGQVWSLSIEWQFYLVWPLLLVALLRFAPRLVLPVTALAMTASALASDLLYRHGAGSNRVYFGTDTQAQALLAGALAAELLMAGRLDRLVAWRPWRVVAAGAGLLLVLLTVFLPSGVAAWRAHWGYVVVEVAAAVVVVTLCGHRGFGERILTWAPLAYVGRRSYAIYLWSYVFATWFRTLGAWQLLLTVVASLAVAELSWRFVEQPALRRKGRLEPPQAAAPAPTAEHADLVSSSQ